MHFTVEAQRRAEASLFLGAVVVDATAGNGFDTQFLAERVGPDGLVIAIDIQPCAIERAGLLLGQKNLSFRTLLSVGDHANLKHIVAPKYWGEIACIMFNLGYLPSGDKTVITRKGTTISALMAAASMLRPAGLLTVIAYVGHAGGREEAEAVAQWMESVRGDFEIASLKDDTNPDSPILWTARKKGTSVQGIKL